jgi:DNA polymerase III gamma/tau subunit
MEMSPSPGSKCRIWIFDEAHSFTIDAQRILLKALEDTPEHVYFMLCTTEPQKLLDTILDRCTKFPVTLLKDRELTEIVRSVVKSEEWDVSPETMKKIAKASLGSARNALVILDQVRDLPKDMIDEAINQIVLMEIKVKELCQALVAKTKEWEKIVGILEGLEKENPESIRLAVMGYFKKVIKNKEPNMGAWWVLKTFYRYPTYNIGMTAIWIASFEAVFMVTDEEDEK